MRLFPALALLCWSSAASAQEPPPPPDTTAAVEQPESSFPAEAAGFRFGWSVTDAERACAGARHVWRATSVADQFFCGGTAASIGHPAELFLNFSEGRLFSISIFLTLTPGEVAAVSVRADLKRALERRYGVGVPSWIGSESCREAAARGHLACIALGSGGMRVRWEPEPGRRITLVLSGSDAQLAVSLLYTDGELEPRADAPDGRSL